MALLLECEVTLNQHPMLRNYFVTAYRNLLRNKFFTLINIFGLVLGMAACIMIAEYVSFEQSYDRFHTGYENIYRLVNVRYFPTHKDESAGCVTALGPATKELFPEVLDFARCYKSDRVFVVNNTSTHFDNVFTVDSTFLSVFSFPALKGNIQRALRKPQTAVLTESAARKLFGDQDPIGQVISQSNVLPYEVEAVVADPPQNSHIRFEILLSLITDLNNPEYCITCNNRNTYILLADKTDASAFEKKLQHVIPKIHPEEILKREYKLQPLSSIHLHSNIRFEHEKNGNARSVSTLTLIAILILIIAWLNYINLTTSMAVNRSNEVGIRKVNGSARKDIVFQFLLEAFLVNFISVAIAIVAAQTIFPFFGSLLGIHSTLTLFYNPAFWLITFTVLVIGSFVYGFYPAFIISSFKPIQAMKGRTYLPKSATSMRTVLVFLQFTFSIVFMACTLTVYRQINFMKNMDLGMAIDQTLVLPVPDEFINKEDDFEDALMRNGTIKKVAHASEIPGTEISSVGGGFRPEGASIESGQQVYTLYVSKNYFDFFSIDFLAGQGFLSEQTNIDTERELIINDAASKAFGFTNPDAALGKIISQNDRIVGRIRGVTKDHHQRSADNPITPMIFQFTKGRSYILVKTDPAALTASLDIISKAVEKYFPNNPFEYYFLDEQFNRQYNDYIRFGNVFGIFTLLAIFISCLGLSGLSMYIIRIRTKEIAIRKVLGASISHLLFMLSKEYVTLISMALVIAMPIAYYGMSRWLSGFAYAIEIQWWLFLLPGILVMAMAWGTISLQSLKTMFTNPTESLRSE
jgi:putative ABC transport system permease protein